MLDTGGATLLRALEVPNDESSLKIMQELRNSKKKKSENPESDAKVKVFKPHELANGPSKLCLTMNITRDLCNKIDMIVSNDLWLEHSTNEQYFNQEFEIDVSRRVGIDRTPPEARDQLYRFFIKGNSSVSPAKFKTVTNSPKDNKRKK